MKLELGDQTFSKNIFVKEVGTGDIEDWALISLKETGLFSVWDEFLGPQPKFQKESSYPLLLAK